MSFLKTLTDPWAIDPAKYTELIEFYNRRVLHGKDSLEAYLAQGGVVRPAVEPFQVNKGVAIISMEGVLAKKMNLLTQISGGTSMQQVGQAVQTAADSPDIRAIVLNVDSPGGTVDGTQDLATVIAQVRRSGKPITAFTGGMMASAALWIGAAAGRIVIGGDTTAVGSIGVIATHTDLSKRDEAQGIKTTEIVSSRFKNVPSAHEPLSEEGRDLLQQTVNHLHRVFVRDLASFRGVEAEELNERAGTGQVFLGKQAIEVGLADEMQSFPIIAV